MKHFNLHMSGYITISGERIIADLCAELIQFENVSFYCGFCVHVCHVVHPSCVLLYLSRSVTDVKLHVHLWL